MTRQIDGVSYLREVSIRYRGSKRKFGPFLNSKECARYFAGIIGGDSREHLVALYLDGRHSPIAHAVVSVGTANRALVHPREVFQPAIAVGACALIVCHNHPGGDPTASPEDYEATRRLAKAGELLGIRLLDHLICGDGGAYLALYEAKPELFN